MSVCVCVSPPPETAGFCQVCSAIKAFSRLSGAATLAEWSLLPSLFILFIERSHGEVSPAGESQRPRLRAVCVGVSWTENDGRIKHGRSRRRRRSLVVRHGTTPPLHRLHPANQPDEANVPLTTDQRQQAELGGVSCRRPASHTGGSSSSSSPDRTLQQNAAFPRRRQRQIRR